MNKFTIAELSKKIDDLNKKRNWNKYHFPKNIAISIVLEASELLELFQWQSLEESLMYSLKDRNKQKISDELADIIIYCINLSNKLDIDLEKAILNKLNKNKKKYQEKHITKRST